MRTRVLVLCVLWMTIAGIVTTGSPLKITSGSVLRVGSDESGRSKLVGRWSGNAAIVVNWTKQKSLPLHLEIDSTGKVTGTVGDARLLDGKFVSNALGSTRFRVHGRLQGNLIDQENIRRGAVDILFNAADDGSLVGGLHSSGSKFGGKESMKLSATKMVLRRDTPAEE